MRDTHRGMEAHGKAPLLVSGAPRKCFAVPQRSAVSAAPAEARHAPSRKCCWQGHRPTDASIRSIHRWIVGMNNHWAASQGGSSKQQALQKKSHFRRRLFPPSRRPPNVTLNPRRQIDPTIITCYTHKCATAKVPRTPDSAAKARSCAAATTATTTTTCRDAWSTSTARTPAARRRRR